MEATKNQIYLKQKTFVRIFDHMFLCAQMNELMITENKHFLVERG